MKKSDFPLKQLMALGQYLRRHRGVRAFTENYLVDNNPKGVLTHLFAPSLVAYLSNGVWILGVIILIFWPQRELPSYLIEHEVPFNFLITFDALLFGSLYVNLLCGRGEMMIAETYVYQREPPVTREESENFFTYGFVRFFIQTCLFLLPFLPFLWISGLLSQASPQGIFKSLVVIASFSLCCRLIGFVTYLLWSIELKGHYSSRILIIVFLGATFYYVPWINPLRLIYDLHRHAEKLVTTSFNSYSVYLMFITSVILVLTIFAQMLIHRKQSREL